jgi:ABC-2 type transport system ATP-binding protein
MIRIENLDFSYQKGKPMFQQLKLELKPGHIYGLLGKNGAGKSTLLKNMTGLTRPTSGKCLINGSDSAKRSISLLEELYFIAENIYVPALTPGQFLKRTSVFYPKFNVKEFYNYLKTFDIDHEQVMTQMSYGQQKKTMIAFGLATNANLLIMDEPTNGLDIPSKVQFRKLIASALNDERYIIISTHQVRDLESLIDSIVILNDHQISLESTIDDLADKLIFGSFDDTTGMDVLYEEETLRGKRAILQNTTGKYSKIDLDLLFNAATTGNNRLTGMLKQGGGHE